MSQVTIEITMPRHGDSLPFVVAENNGRTLEYDENGQLRLDGRDEAYVSSFAELLGIPEELVIVQTSVVAHTKGGGDTSLEIGSVTGFLERLNIHKDARTCYIFPNHGAKKVKCKFTKDIQERVIDAVGQYVTMHGVLKYTSRQLFAEEIIRVSDIEVHPPLEQLPTLRSLRGSVEGPLRRNDE